MEERKVEIEAREAIKKVLESKEEEKEEKKEEISTVVAEVGGFGDKTEDEMKLAIRECLLSGGGNYGNFQTRSGNVLYF